MRNHISTSRALILALVLAAAGCGAPPAEEGFQLAFQMQNVSANAIEQLRVTITPRDEMGAHAFENIPTTTYEGGAITVDVDDAGGFLVMTITGDYVRAHLEGTDPLNPRFAVEIWSDDEAMRMGPQIRGTVIRMGEQIATGSGYFREWPLGLGDTTQINVICSPMFTAQCAAP